jgi:non-canonical (house-cleaning) NTP pyrophosphatase
MKITVGTKNQSKVTIVSDIMTEFLPNEKLNIQGIDIPSGVPDTPRGEETKQGALNRASAAAKQEGATYGVGIESGLVDRYGVWFEEAWACIVFNGRSYYGYSSGLPIPRYVLKTMQRDDIEHGQAMRQIRKELNQFDDRDTWGTYSGKLILRDISLQEALRNAIVQIVTSKENLYHL